MTPAPCPRASDSAHLRELNASQRVQVRTLRFRRDEAVHHQLAAGAIEVDRQLLAVHSDDAAGPELEMKHASAGAKGRIPRGPALRLTLERAARLGAGVYRARFVGAPRARLGPPPARRVVARSESSGDRVETGNSVAAIGRGVRCVLEVDV